VSISYNCHML